MKKTVAFFLLVLLTFSGSGQKVIFPVFKGKPLTFISTGEVMQDLKQYGKNSKYWETAQDLIYLDENLIPALNALQSDAVTPENIEMIRYVNARDQKPYREIWDHNLLVKCDVNVTDIRSYFTNAELLADLKKKVGRDLNRLDAAVYTNGPDRVMFILRSPNSDAGSFYRAILSGITLRIDEISNWRDE